MLDPDTGKHVTNECPTRDSFEADHALAEQVRAEML
jgi:hypothetical protein